MNRNQTSKVGSKAWRRFATFLAVVLAVATVGTGVALARGMGSDSRSRTDVMAPGGDDVYQRRGAYLQRTDHSVEVQWRLKTPKSGSYTYPTPDMVPPGAPIHPALNAGDTEVFTLWLFTFNNPELCSDDVCDGNDVGDTAAGGSVFQIDGEIAYKNRLQMAGKVRIGQPAANGPGLSNPEGAEVHVAMAPHGQALTGSELVHQLNSPVGNPTLWWSAAFRAE